MPSKLRSQFEMPEGIPTKQAIQMNWIFNKVIKNKRRFFPRKKFEKSHESAKINSTEPYTGRRTRIITIKTKTLGAQAPNFLSVPLYGEG